MPYTKSTQTRPWRFSYKRTHYTWKSPTSVQDKKKKKRRNRRNPWKKRPVPVARKNRKKKPVKNVKPWKDAPIQKPYRKPQRNPTGNKFKRFAPVFGVGAGAGGWGLLQALGNLGKLL